MAFTPSILLVLLFSCFLSFTHALPRAFSLVKDPPPETCRNPVSPFDYSVKARSDVHLPICPASATTELVARQVTQQDDYSCGPSKPCKNGACCSKKTGYCNYGPEACGTNGQSPNDVCWSNCNAFAECGRYANPPGKQCPLNVCCSQFGFCGMTEEFCKKTSDNSTCQSNCDQPGSGRSGGNVRQRIIGYYEGWVYNRKCNGMSIDQIPVNALTHLYFAFGYINPSTFDIAPMDDLPQDLFSKITEVKKRNSGLKVIVALGGWTFNDNGTSTQPVFSNICSNSANRARFITNLLSFMRNYAFDGVDFDWEYPGAPDRGGKEGDGVNFTQLLKELRAAIQGQPVQYVVSFTTPTSYWYLRHFDLKAADYADFVNVMSYDLHGVWDSWNPIGSRVLAHTNLTEMKLALDLYWRNNVPAEKLNIGLGFYGRSFQLSDPTCYTPGCAFKAGASPGSCTANSGTLSYREITDLIKAKNIKPYYDKTAQVKYMVWDNDQWISYDDKDTFQAKIDFANNLGLGGLLIWSIDQDTDNLDALRAVTGKDGIEALKSLSDDDSYWKDATAQDCYVTDCGGKCKVGFLQITTQPCGGAKPVIRTAKEKDSALCCPVDNAPDPKNCRWRGGAPSCNGHCEDGEVALELNKWGDGKYCEDGNKAYCCTIPDAKNLGCYFSSNGGKCNSGDKAITFAGTFLSTIADFARFAGLTGDLLASALDSLDMDLRKYLCCTPAGQKRWKNCSWRGQPGSCFDNHCDTGHQVQVAQSDYGGGQSCAPRFERTRVWCCDPADGESPFLPVPLDRLFPKPPTGDKIDTDYDLKTDNTWGDGKADTNSQSPNDASFAFWVLASPTEIQISLDKRDGSGWELFNCNNDDSEEEQTVQMVCTDPENGECDKIYLGHGVPGTILEMPQDQGCGPSKYAVAKSLVKSVNQTLPPHLAKRTYNHVPVIYDLTFDYNWHRVPRDLGDTQMRIDFSNEAGYWDAVVAKAARKKSKRSLKDMNYNHRRWLEEEWRDDYHHGGLSKEELHKRWFGSDIISWLKGLINGEIKTEFTHDYSDTITAIIMRENWNCPVGNNGQLSARLSAVASASVKVSTTFGMTILTTLPGLDLSNSYLLFKNKGEIKSVFTIDALAKATYKSGDIPLTDPIPLPGAGFRIPKIMTVGPSLKLLGSVEAELEISGKVEIRVDIASWDIRQTYPVPNDEWKPKQLDAPDRDFNTKGLSPPKIDASVKASGYVTAHLMPTVSFGVEFDERWKLGACTVDLVADGSLTLRAQAQTGSGCNLQYGVDAAAALIARAKADPFKWSSEFTIVGGKSNVVPGDGKDWVCLAGGSRRGLQYGQSYDTIDGPRDTFSELHESLSVLNKRASTYGPIIKLPEWTKQCPGGSGTSNALKCNETHGYTADQLADPRLQSKRSWLPEISDNQTTENLVNRDTHHFWKRVRDQTFCEGDAVMTIKFQSYPGAATPIYDALNWNSCNDYTFGVPPGGRTGGHDYAVEHVLELQMIQTFMDDYFKGGNVPTGKTAGSMCKYLKKFWYGRNSYITLGGVTAQAWDHVGRAYPGDHANSNEFIMLEKEINAAKMRGFSERTESIQDTYKMQEYVAREETARNGLRVMKNAICAYKYMNQATISATYLRQVTRVEQAMNAVEAELVRVTASATDPQDQYATTNMGTAWRIWIRGWTTGVRFKFEDFFTTGLQQLDGWVPSRPDPNMSQARIDLATDIIACRTEVTAVTGTWTLAVP